MTLWLIEAGAGDLLTQALASRWRPTAAQEAEIEARSMALSQGNTPRILTLAGTTAEIRIEGILTKRPDILAMIFGSGGTSYVEIVRALQVADQDPNIQEIHAYVDSPGGHVSGLFDAIAAIQGTSKPMRVTASNASSAAYALASTMGRIEAMNPAATFGSIGVIAQFYVPKDVITMTSTEAPNKAQDPSTESGRKEIQAYMDGLHELFVEAIAQGRGVSPSTVNSTFGRGSSFLAAQAKERGLIDSISAPMLKAVGTPTHAALSAKSLPLEETTEHKIMDLKAFKAQHADLYEAVIQLGVDQERERVAAHLSMADSTGAEKVAIEAIKAGTRIDHQPTLAKYFAQGRNRQDQADRAEDDKAVVEATAQIEASAQVEDMGDLIAKQLVG